MRFVIITSFIVLFALPSCAQTGKHDNKIKIQSLPDFTLDGRMDEWQEIPERKLYADPSGNFPEKEDLTASFKLAWKDDNLLFLFRIKDDVFLSDSLMPWKGDAVEIFLTEYHGSDNIIQYSVVTGTSDSVICRINDYRKSITKIRKPSLNGFLNQKENEIILELTLDMSVFDFNSGKGEFALQVYVDDSDIINDKYRNQLTWHPLGHSYINSFAAFEIQPTFHENRFLNGTSRVVITDEEVVEIYFFGTKKGDKININSESRNFDFISASLDPYQPEIFILDDLDPEKDCISIFLNEEFQIKHALFLAPRNYEEIQARRFDREIRLFRMKDMINMPEKGGVLFIGSSSIRMWNSLKKDFPGLNIVHRGFGGSTSADALFYMDYIVLPYKPSVIVYYEGDNDIPGGMSYHEIIQNMRNFIERAREYNREVMIYMISPKPSIARMHLWEKYLKLHEKMKKMTEDYDSVFFVDVSSEMFDADGKLREDIFLEDGVHMNEEGYEIWKNTLNNEMNLNVNE